MADPRPHADPALAAVLRTLAPAAFAPVLTSPELLDRGVWPAVVPATVAGALALGSVNDSMLARAAASVGLLAGATAWVSCHLHQPGLGAIVWLCAISLLSAVWPAPYGSYLRAVPPVAAASAVAWFLAIYSWPARLVGPLGDLAIAAAVVVPALVAYTTSSDRAGRQLASAALLLPVAWTLANLGGLLGTRSSVFLALGPAALFVRAFPTARVWRPLGRVAAEVLSSPPRLIVSSFAGLSTVGTLLLALPISDAGGRGLPLVDAAFEAVAAVTLTGLGEPERLSTFGRFVTFVAFQAGALLVMTFAALSANSARSKDVVAARMFGADVRRGVTTAMRRILLVSLAIEAVGAALLFPALLSHGRGLSSLGEAVFLSTSAFCNAGATPWAGSMAPFVRDPFVIVVVALLALVGSLGPAVILAIPPLFRGASPPTWLRVTYVANLFLLIVPAALFLGLEWSRSLSMLPAHGRVASAFLATASARTAGFTTTDLAVAEPATRTLLMLLMVVGGSTGSVAGGVKVTTMAVLLSACVAYVRGRRSVELGSRQIPPRLVYRSVAVVATFVATVVLGTVLLQLTQRLPPETLLFEVVSAVSTAGFTGGASAQVDGVGRIVLLGCMFAGRVGPLTLLLLLSSEPEREGGATVPSEEVPVG